MKSISYRPFFVLWCIVILFLLTAFTGISVSTIFAYSSGPPDGRTGSPVDGKTCNDDCHTSYPLNSGTAVFSISGPASYTSGETLNMTVSFGNSTTAKHGFELSALDTNNNHVGTFSNVDSNTQTINGDYIKHTSAGSSQSGNASWNVQWTAPTSEVQNFVTFYVAGNEANGDSTYWGDYIYTTITQINRVVSTPSPSPTPSPTPTTSPVKGMVYGTVNDSFEDTLEGVTVTITGEGITGRYITETDEDGYYEIPELVAGDYTLTYEKEGYVTQKQEISLGEGETKELDTINMPLMSTNYGYVVNVKGEPINKARLKLKGINTKYVKTGYSDGEGYFEFTGLEADTYLIFVKKKGYLPKKIRVKLNEGEEKDVGEIILRRKS